MVQYNNIANITTAFQPMVGHYHYADVAHRPDTDTALALAQLQPGNTVLELGPGSGHLIAQAKVAVGSGFCAAVDAVQGFLDVDIPSALAQQGLDGSVSLLRANITDGALVKRVRSLPGAPQTFDYIFALHVFSTIPPPQRRQTLRNLRKLLSPTGSLIVTIAARFTDIAPLQAETALPVQFRSTGHTEAPGATLLTQVRCDEYISVPSGASLPIKRVASAIQHAPDRFWDVAAQQALDAATHAGYIVLDTRNIGKGDNFGLGQGGRSPPQSLLNNMGTVQLAAAASQASIADCYCCVGRIMQAACPQETPNWQHMSQQQRDYCLAMFLQCIVARNADRVRNLNQHLPANGVLAEAQEATQVSVLIVLRKA